MLDNYKLIDWYDDADLKTVDLSLSTLFLFHPRLRAVVELDVNVEETVQHLSIEESRLSLLLHWKRAGFFETYEKRWCAKCRIQGHTKSTCTNQPQLFSLLQRHSEKKHALQQAALAAGELRKGKRLPQVSLGNHSRVAVSRGMTSGVLVGHIVMLDTNRGFGEIEVAEVSGSIGRIPFHTDRTDFGLKHMVRTSEVRFILEYVNDRQMAAEVQPTRSTFIAEDVVAFVAACDVGGAHPVDQMRHVIQRKLDWPDLLKAILDVHIDPAIVLTTIIRMVNFPPNKEPLHRAVLSTFLGLMTSQPATNSDQCFFPDLVVSALPSRLTWSEQSIDVLLEICDFTLSVRCYTIGHEEAVTFAASRISVAIDEAQQLINPLQRLETRKLARAKCLLAEAVSPTSVATISLTLLPNEIRHPPVMNDSPLNCRSLPKTDDTFRDVPTLAAAHLTLLRADIFTTAANVLAVAINNKTASQNTSVQDDVAHTRIYHHVRLLGRCISRDWDRSAGFLLGFSLPAVKDSMNSFILPGRCVCLLTQHRSKPDDDFSMLWGILGTVDAKMSSSLVTAFFPVSGNAEIVMEALRENEANESTHLSRIFDTQVFYQGYRPVAMALQTLVGPRHMPLTPFLQRTIVAQKLDKLPAVEYIPQHYVSAFDRIVDGVRSRLVLDAGQDEALMSIRSSPFMLIQGPPGTGKSFIGCRLAEVFLRYKTRIKTGDILMDIDVNHLQHCNQKQLQDNPGPVVVITYKNHALDEFLTDLKKSGLWCGDARDPSRCACTGCFAFCCPKCCSHSSGIVRVGGGCQEPLLQGFNITDLLEAQPPNRAVIQGRHKVGNQVRRMERLASEILLLEQGQLLQSHLDQQLTPEQLASFSACDIPAWLSGANYIGMPETTPCVQLTSLESSLAKLLLDPVAPPVADIPTYRRDEEEEDDGIETAFSKMRRESRTVDDRDMQTIRNTAISEAAVQLSLHLPVFPETISRELQNLWSLSPSNRILFHRRLVQTAISVRAQQYQEACTLMETEVALLNHARDQMKLDVLRDADVIGLTTTGCAMHQHVIRSLRPSLLIVEEAAEILESQLLACMTESMKQVILIGDHYQLQPKVETMDLQRHNKLNISLFERMVTHAKTIRLTEQRRMRPSISRLVSRFYEDGIIDHSSVASRRYVCADGRSVSQLPGLVHDVFLWTHSQQEALASVGRSKVNFLEINLTLGLVRHLLRCGVRPTSIAVISPYLGQRRLAKLELERFLGKETTSHMRISTVDRFQGDESDIVILSMVRTAQLTDFLRMRNRMIVALSRARFSMVIIGNDDLLMKSEHWAQVVAVLRSEGKVGNCMPVRCDDTGSVVAIPSSAKLGDWPAS